MKKILLSCACLVLLNGCALTSHIPPTQSYFIPFKPITTEQKGNKILKVEKPYFTRDFASTAMEYEKNGVLYEYAYSKWSSPVSEMLGNLLTHMSETSGVFKDALMASSESKSDFILESTILSFRQYINEEKSSAIFEIKLSLINAQSKTLIDSKRFSYKEPCKEFSAKGGVDTFAFIMKQFEKDVKLWLKNQPI